MMYNKKDKNMRNYELICNNSKYTGLDYSCIFISLESAKRFVEEHNCKDEYESICVYDYIPFTDEKINKTTIK